MLKIICGEHLRAQVSRNLEAGTPGEFYAPGDPIGLALGDRIIKIPDDCLIVGPLDLLLTRDCHEAGVSAWTVGAPRSESVPEGFVVPCGTWAAPPKDARIVYGCDECDAGWAEAVRSGFGAVETVLVCNVAEERLRENCAAALALGLPEFAAGEATDRDLAIVAGGPSAALRIEEISARAANGQAIWAVNGSARWLLENGITPDALWIVDARPENAAFCVPVPTYLASQCDPAVFAAAHAVTLYHDANCGPWLPEGKLLLGGGSTVGMKALAAACVAGFRRIHLYGMDSSIAETHHAYPQPGNDGDEIYTAWVNGRSFQVAPWMFRQVEDFQALAPQLAERGCEIHVHCDGLLGCVAQEMMRPVASKLERWAA